MSRLSLPALPVNGNVIDAVGLDAIFNQLQSEVNSIDSTNLGPSGVAGLVGPAGITTRLLDRADHLTQLGWFSVRDFGAAGDGTTDDTAAIAATIAAASASPNGATIYFPAGTYYIATGGFLTRNNLTFIGLSSECTVLLAGMTNGGALFSDAASRTNLRFSGLAFDGGGRNAGGIALAGLLTNVIVKDCTFRNVNGLTRALYLGAVSTSAVLGSNVAVLDCLFINNSTGTLETCLIGGTKGVYVRGTFSGNTSTGAAALAIYGYNDTVRIESLFINNTQDCYVQQSTNVTFAISSFYNSGAYASGHAVSIINSQRITFDASCSFYQAGGNASFVWIYDYNGATFDGNPTLYQNSSHITIDGQFAGSFYNGVVCPAQTDASKNLAQSWIKARGRYNGNTNAAVLFDGAHTGAALAHVCVEGITVEDGAWSASGGVQFNGIAGAGISDAFVSGGTIGSSSGTGASAISVNGASDVRVTGSDLHRNTAPIAVSNGGTLTLARNVPGYNPLAGNAASPALPASGIWQNNPNPVDCMVAIYGGTVTEIDVAAVGGANPVSIGLASGMFMVPAGGAIRWQGTALPTSRWYGL